MSDWLSAGRAMQKLISCALESSQYPLTKVVVGWPEARELKERLRSGEFVGYISVYAVGHSQNVSRYSDEALVTPIDATETITVNGSDITIGGIPTPGDNIFLYVNLVGVFNVHVDANDTLSDLATKLAAAVNAANAGFSATAAGTTVTLISGSTIINKFKCRAFGQGIVQREVARESQRFQITIFAPNAEIRSILARAALASLSRHPRIELDGGIQARLFYQSGGPEDFGMSSGLMTERLYYAVEYPIFHEEKAARVGDLPVDVARCTPDGEIISQRFHVF